MSFAVVLQELTWKCILRVLSRMLNGIEEILSEIGHSPMTQFNSLTMALRDILITRSSTRRSEKAMAYIKYRRDFRTVDARMKRLREFGVLEWIHYKRVKDSEPDAVLRSIQKTFYLSRQ